MEKNYLMMLQYNNYYNRQVLKESSLADYSNFLLLGQEVNFNPNDGVATTQIVNDMPSNNMPNYVLILDENQTTIISRWFIIEAKRTLRGQYELKLRRDVLVDYYASIINAPAMVERAMLNEEDPFIFNREGQSYNQIKQSEHLLKDATNSAWIVGYYAKNRDVTASATATPPGLNDLVIRTKTPSVNAINIGTTLAAWKYNITDESNPLLVYGGKGQFEIRSKQLIGEYPQPTYYVEYLFNLYFNGQISETEHTNYYLQPNQLMDGYPDKAVLLNKYDTILASFKTDKDFITADELKNIQNTYDGKVIYTSDGKYYKVNITPINVTKNDEITSNNYPNTYATILSVATQAGLTNYNKGAFRYSLSLQGYIFAFEELTGAETTLKVTSTPKQTHDAPAYNIFAIPFNSVKVVNSDNQAAINTNADIAIEIATAIATTLGDACYDLQLLPYCPVNYLLTGSTIIASETDGDVSFVKDAGNNNIAVVLWSEISQFSFDIQHIIEVPRATSGTYVETTSTLTRSIELPEEATAAASTYNINFDVSAALEGLDIVEWHLEWHSYNSSGVQIDDVAIYGDDFTGSNIICTAWKYYLNVRTLTCTLTYVVRTGNYEYLNPLNIDVKTCNETDLWRLCSPNYSGVFEFNVARNNGVTYFNVDCTYKPYNPYIHINPNFRGLYGQDFNDARGLICGGDFSLARIIDHFIQYELNNKNYQNVFDRNIESLELQQKWEQAEQAVGAITGTIQGGLTGAMAGAQVGGGYGAIIGGVVGTGASAIGGALDVIEGKELRADAKDKAYDMFRYNLQNIQAMPYTLSKVTAYNLNNKIYPFIEYYTATDTEKQALFNKLTYYSMTVNRVGTIQEFMRSEETYIKADIIRLPNLNDEYHLAQAITYEVSLGAYWKEG